MHLNYHRLIIMCKRKNLTLLLEGKLYIVFYLYLKAVDDKVQCVTWRNIFYFRISYKDEIYLIEIEMIYPILILINYISTWPLAYIYSNFSNKLIVLPKVYIQHFFKINTQYYYLVFFFNCVTYDYIPIKNDCLKFKTKKLCI